MEKDENVFCNSLNLLFLFKYGTIDGNTIDNYGLCEKNGNSFIIPTDENSINERKNNGRRIANNIIKNIKYYEFTFVNDNYIEILLLNAVNSSLRDDTVEPLEILESIISSANENHVNTGKIDKKTVEELLEKNKYNLEIIKYIQDINNLVKQNNKNAELVKKSSELKSMTSSFTKNRVIEK